MAITPEQAKSELQRRAREELARRSGGTLDLRISDAPVDQNILAAATTAVADVQRQDAARRELRRREQPQFEAAPKRSFVSRLFASDNRNTRPWPDQSRIEKFDTVARGVISPVVGAANVTWRGAAFLLRPAWAAFKRTNPDAIPKELRDKNLDQAISWATDRDPGLVEDIIGGVREFVGPANLAGRGIGAVTGPVPKSIGAAGNAIRTAIEWGAGAAINEAGKAAAGSIDPNADYGYQGAIHPVSVAIGGGAVGAIGATQLPVVAKKAAESAVFGGQTAIEGGTPEDIAIAAAVPLVMGGRDINPREGSPTDIVVSRKRHLRMQAKAEKPRIQVPVDAVKKASGMATEPSVAGTTPTMAESVITPDISEPAGATPTEGQFSIRNEATGQVRQEVGLPPRVVPSSESVAQWRQQAIEQGIPEMAESIAKDVVTTGRPLTDVETQGLEIRIKQIKGEYDRLEAAKAGKSQGGPEVKGILKAQAEARDKLLNLIDASEQGGREASYSMISRKGLKAELTDDTSPAAMTTKAEIAKGDKLTEAETEAVTAKTGKVRKAREGERRVSQQANAKSADSILKVGKRRGGRYSKMTEAEKDVELTKLLDIYQKDQNTAALAQIAKNLASRPDINNIGDVMTRLQDTLPDIDQFKLADALVETARQRIRIADETAMKVAELAGEARTQDKLRTAIDDYLWHYREGTVPETNRKTRKPDTEMNEALRMVRDHVKKLVDESEPAQLQRLQATLDFLNARLENGDYAPPPKGERPLRSEAVEKKMYEISLAREELQRQIAKLTPSSRWRKWTGWTRAIQSLKSSYDVSAVRRQGGLMVLSHPIMSGRRIPDMFRALMNPEESFRLNSWLTNPDNPRAWLYRRSGLEFTDPSGLGGLTAKEEEFQSNWADQHIPGVAQSNRAFSTFLNLVRADAFDSMTAAFTKPGNVSLAEAKSIAAYINIATGRGDISHFKEHAATLNGLLWSPRFTISRFEYHLGIPLWRANTNRARGIIAKEYARSLVGTAVVLMLYKEIFGGTIELDPRSSDFLKIKIGNTRLDPLAGLSQVTVFLAREITGSTKNQQGEVKALRRYATLAHNKEIPYRGDTVATVLGRFFRYKLGWAPGAVWTAATGEDAIGRKADWKYWAAQPLPLSLEDIYPLMREQGIPKGLALETLQMFGEGVQTYEPRESGHSGGRLPASYRR